MLAFILASVLSIDAAHSSAQFSVSHIFVAHVQGTVPIIEGTIERPSDDDVPASVHATLDARGIKTDDEDRNRSLRGPDFFDVEKYPTWTFASTKITKTAPNAFTMDGTLTIHGVTQPESLAVTISQESGLPHYHATCRIDRHAFDMKRSRLDPVIGGQVDVTLDITAKP